MKNALLVLLILVLLFIFDILVLSSIMYLIGNFLLFPILGLSKISFINYVATAIVLHIINNLLSNITKK